MTEIQHDLTGRWAGVYFYPIDIDYNPMDAMPPVPFSAELNDLGGVLDGSITEQDPLGPSPNSIRRASLVGSRLGSEIIFTKHPDQAGDIHDDFEIPHAIEYVGTLSSDGNSIAGDWHIIGGLVRHLQNAAQVDSGNCDTCRDGDRLNAIFY